MQRTNRDSNVEKRGRNFIVSLKFRFIFFKKRIWEFEDIFCRLRYCSMISKLNFEKYGLKFILNNPIPRKNRIYLID